MKHFPMITISRMNGTGGHEIAELLAEKLSIPFYDKDLIAIAAKEGRVHESAFDKAEESATSAFGYALSNRATKVYGMPFNDQLFMLQSGVIRNIADQGPALFVGRCADFVLSGYKETINIFLYATPEARMARLMEREGITQKEAEAKIRRLDKSRAIYYNYYTDRNWSDLGNYDMVLNVSHLTPQESADLLYTFIRQVVDKTGAIEAETREIEEAQAAE